VNDTDYGESIIINRPMVSVIIPNWNGKSVIRDCLTSLQRLTYPNYEVIVVDNGSTDGSVKMIREEFPTIELVISPLNLGFAGACNLGIKASKGQLVALFNSDAIADPCWLSELVDCISKEDDIAMASGLIFYEKPCDVLWSAGARIDGITGMPYHIGRGERLHSINTIEDVDYLPGCAIIFPRIMIKKVGLLDESYFLYGEELDWTFRAKRLGYKIRLNPHALVWHKASITRRRNPPRGYYHLVRGYFRIYFKHFPLKYLVTSLFFQLVMFPIFEALLFRTSSLYFVQRMKAFAWNITKLKEIMIERNRANLMGKIELKNRFKELLVVTRRHVVSNSYDF
jgi:GT2 family glycosyltransferase